jgi:Fur family peroxide stress response transcriptional regulator
MWDINIIRTKISESGLKVTPQRMAVLKAVADHGNHPTAEEVFQLVTIHNPNISLGTVYKTLDTFVEKSLLCNVKTDSSKMRYDADIEKHHHLYDCNTDKIGDYHDEELNQILEAYFSKKKIENFRVTDLKLNIIGYYEK